MIMLYLKPILWILFILYMCYILYRTYMNAREKARDRKLLEQLEEARKTKKRLTS